MARLTNRLRNAWLVATLLLGSFYSCASLAELDLVIDYDMPKQKHIPQTFDPLDVYFQMHAGNISKYKMSKDLRIRGWQFSDKVYFGQAKVGKKWGIGVIVDRGQYVYGINNQGIQVLRRF